MPVSASRQKRLAEKAAKKSAGGTNGDSSPMTSTPAGSVNGASTPLTSMSGMNSKAGSSDDLMSMARLNIATDRYVCQTWIPLGFWLFFTKWILGVPLVSWFLISKVEISRLIHILCLSMEDYLSKVLRSRSTMDSDMVYLDRTVLERCVSLCASLSFVLIFYISQVYFSSINRRARYWNSISYRHLYRPWRSRTFGCQCRRFHRRIGKSKSCPSWSLHRRTISSRRCWWASPRPCLRRTWGNGSKHIWSQSR